MAAFAPFVTTYTPEPTRCSGGERPGARALQDWACDESPWASVLFDVGIYACRDVFGGWCPACDRDNLSQHAAGGAGDSAHTTVAGASHPAGIAFAAWLVENHAVLGVQEVICNRRRWDNQTKRWRAYNGRSPHIDHVHWTLNESGRRYLTRARILSVAPNPQPAPPEDDDMKPTISWLRATPTSSAGHAYLVHGTTATHIVNADALNIARVRVGAAGGDPKGDGSLKTKPHDFAFNRQITVLDGPCAGTKYEVA